MDRRELEIMLNDAFDRGIVTARAVEGIYPPAVTVGILDDLGREIDFGHEGSGLTVFLPGIEDDARFAGSCKALGGKVPQNTYRMELVSATAAVISDDGGHVVVDVDLNGSAPVGDATEQADMKSSQGESVSDAEPDEALKAFEALMTANDIIIRSAFYYILLPSLFAMALPLLLYELLELHDRRRL